MKLWELFRYEHLRGPGINSIAYHTNSLAAQDDVTFRLQFS
jgi:hypothetical protein